MVKWDTEADVLRVFQEGASEPTFWAGVAGREGLEAGSVASLQAGGAARKVVSVRMLRARETPLLTGAEIRRMVPLVSQRLLSELGAGHVELLRRQGPVGPRTALEAADRLAEAVRGALFGATRDIRKRVRAAGHEDPREWVEAALEAYDRLRKPCGAPER